MRRFVILSIKIAASFFALTFLGVLVLVAVLFNYGLPSAKASRSKSKIEVVERTTQSLGIGQTKSRPEEVDQVAAHDNVTSVDSKASAAENFLVKINSLLSAPVTVVNLCKLDCEQLGGLLQRQKDYWKGNYEQRENLNDDPAFQLAAMVFQAGFGPRGKEIFSLIQQLQKDPISIKSFALVQWMWQLDEMKAYLDGRKNQRVPEGDALIDRIKASSISCSKIRWNEECKLIESEITAWISEGALQ